MVTLKSSSTTGLIAAGNLMRSIFVVEILPLKAPVTTGNRKTGNAGRGEIVKGQHAGDCQRLSGKRDEGEKAKRDY